MGAVGRQNAALAPPRPQTAFQKSSRVAEGEKIAASERVALEGRRLEESARRIGLQVEWVLYKPEHLHILGDLIGAVKVCNPVRRQLRILVGSIVDQVLAAADEEVSTQLPGNRDLVLGRQLETLVRNRL